MFLLIWKIIPREISPCTFVIFINENTFRSTKRDVVKYRTTISYDLIETKIDSGENNRI